MKNFLILLCAFFISTIICNGQLSWLNLPNYPGTGKSGIACFSINGKGYFGLGYAGGVNTATDCYEYDPVGNTWTQKASLPGAGRYSGTSFTIGNKGYFIAGGKSSGLTNETWEFDPVANTWTAKANFPGIARENTAGFVIGNKGYVGTGYASGNTFKDFFEFDPAANTWAIRDSFPGPTRSGAAGFSIGNKGYIGLGNNTNSTFNFKDFYEYDPIANSWTQKADFTLPYVIAPCTYSSVSSGYVLCGYYYQVTGITHNPMNMLYKYDQPTDVWTLSGTFKGLPRGYAGGFSIANDIYIGGGQQENTATPGLLNDFWKLSNGLTLMVQNENEGTDISVYPNPAHDFISIDSQASGKIIDNIRVYDVQGKLISTLKLKHGNRSFDVSSLSNGLYFLELITKTGEVLDSKFVKE